MDRLRGDRGFSRHELPQLLVEPARAEQDRLEPLADRLGGVALCAHRFVGFKRGLVLGLSLGRPERVLNPFRRLGFSGYAASMAPPTQPPQDPRRRWAVYEERYAGLARASDAAWVASLTPADRLAIVDSLLASVRAVRERAGDWEEVDARAWQAALEERAVQVTAFCRLVEVTRGCGPATDAG